MVLKLIINNGGEVLKSNLWQYNEQKNNSINCRPRSRNASIKALQSKQQNKCQFSPTVCKNVISKDLNTTVKPCRALLESIIYIVKILENIIIRQHHKNAKRTIFFSLVLSFIIIN